MMGCKREKNCINKNNFIEIINDGFTIEEVSGCD
jgi:hypothetical protein